MPFPWIQGSMLSLAVLLDAEPQNSLLCITRATYLSCCSVVFYGDPQIYASSFTGIDQLGCVKSGAGLWILNWPWPNRCPNLPLICIHCHHGHINGYSHWYHCQCEAFLPLHWCLNSADHQRVGSDVRSCHMLVDLGICQHTTQSGLGLQFNWPWWDLLLNNQALLSHSLWS